MKKRLILLALGVGVLSGFAEDFESSTVGAFEKLPSDVGRWLASDGHAEINGDHARSGKRSLRIFGGAERSLELDLGGDRGGMLLSFWAERWTARGPFVFRIEAGENAGWREIFRGDGAIRVGGFLTEVAVMLPAGTRKLRFRASTPDKSGLMMDDFTVEKVRPMAVEQVTTLQPVMPVLLRKKDNPVIGLKVATEGRGDAVTVKSLTFDFEGSTDPDLIGAARVFFGGEPLRPDQGVLFGEARKSGQGWICEGRAVLSRGENHFWVSVELNATSLPGGQIDARILKVGMDDGKEWTPSELSPPGGQRIGSALRLHGDGGSKAYRIPGLATTKAGSLIAVYDVRYRGGGDLPGDIDVGMSRSTDGGKSWEEMKVIMDMGSDPKWRYDGVGDPAVLVDEKTGRIWVVAVWSHGNRGWHGSGKGLMPEETGQLMMVWSDDDGVSWSTPRNLTQEVKKPEWHFLLQGPGAGITMKDGTLVFAAQYQDGDTHANGRKKGTPHSTILYSRDHGKNWQVGTGIKSNTTEAQVVELKDGSLMLNCRDDRGGARTVGVTRDLGKTWEMHPTDRKALPEPVCMASLLRVGDRLFFSNPATRRGRYDLTIKVSEDDGMSWPEKWHTVYDARLGNGYSCLAPIGQDHIGVLYEGITELYFLRIPIEELRR
jgi:sialidase-1